MLNDFVRVRFGLVVGTGLALGKALDAEIIFVTGGVGASNANLDEIC